jgi:hypothetical protein
MCVVADWLLLLLHSGFTSLSVVKDPIAEDGTPQVMKGTET